MLTCPHCHRTLAKNRPVVIDYSDGAITINGVRIPAPAKVCLLIEALADNYPRAVPVERLIEALWGDYSGDLRDAENTLNSYISRARKIFKDHGAPVTILRPRNYGVSLQIHKAG